MLGVAFVLATHHLDVELLLGFTHVPELVLVVGVTFDDAAVAVVAVGLTPVVVAAADAMAFVNRSWNENAAGALVAFDALAALAALAAFFVVLDRILGL